MNAITRTEARKRLFPLVEQVVADHTPVEIVSSGGNAILMSKEDFDSMFETAYLLRNPANATHLLTSLSQARHGEVSTRELLS